jgi:ABC-type bacteriocin/lantibiotic exporter with double-glycine peptidase domain
MRAWVLFTIVRVGIFAVLFAAIYAATAQLGSFAWAGAAIIAALLAFCISYIFFGKLRARVASEMAQRGRARSAKAGSDEAAEDSPVDEDR